MTVENFLHTITLGRTAEAWVVSVPPGTDTHDPLWFGGRPHSVPIGDQAPDNAQYYATGLVHQNNPAVRGRKAENWTAATVLVLDDILEKSLDPDEVRACLGDPTFVIQSSRDSFHWGYVYTSALTGEAGRKAQLRLQAAATLKFYPAKKNPGHQGLVQLMRLPYGSNNKAERLAENDGRPWPVQLVEWRPELRHAVLDLEMALGDEWTQTTNISTAFASGGAVTPEEARTAVEADITLSTLAVAGIIVPEEVNGNGYAPVAPCLFAHEHTGGLDDGRAGIHPVTKHYGCFHGSCSERTFAEVKEFAKTNYPGIYAAERARVIGAWFPMIAEVAEEAVGRAMDMRCAQPLGPADSFVSLLQNPPPGAPPARRTICNMLARGEVSYFIGAPSVGKSSVALVYALAIAYERPDLIGEEKLERCGNVVIVSNEDTAWDVLKRIRAFRKQHNLKGVRPLHDIFVTPRRGFTAVVQEGGRGAIELADDMRTWLPTKMAEVGDVAVVLLDTQAATFSGINENDNAAIGQAFSQIGAWSEWHNVATGVLHHGIKAEGSQGGKGKLQLGRGASAAGASVRNGLTLTDLEDHERDKVPPNERRRWVREVVSKSNHTGTAGNTKWWWKDKQMVTVAKTDVLDAEGQPTWGEQEVGVYVYKKQGPAALDFRAWEPDKLLAVVTVVAAAQRAEAPLRVHAAKTGKNAGTDATVPFVETYGWAADNARHALAMAEEKGLVERVESEAKNNPLVWEATKAGLALLKQAENVLERTEG